MLDLPKLNYLPPKHSPLRLLKKASPRTLVIISIFTLLSIGTISGLVLLQSSQDIRQQASTLYPDNDQHEGGSIQPTSGTVGQLADGTCLDNACNCGRVCTTVQDHIDGWYAINSVENGGNGQGYTNVTANTPTANIPPPNADNAQLVEIYNNDREAFATAVRQGVSNGDLTASFEQLIANYQAAGGNSGVGGTTIGSIPEGFQNENANGLVYIQGYGWVTPEKAAEFYPDLQCRVNSAGGLCCGENACPGQQTVTLNQWAQLPPTGVGFLSNCRADDWECAKRELADQEKQGKEINVTMQKLDQNGKIIDITTYDSRNELINDIPFEFLSTEEQQARTAKQLAQSDRILLNNNVQQASNIKNRTDEMQSRLANLTGSYADQDGVLDELEAEYNSVCGNLATQNQNCTNLKTDLSNRRQSLELDRIDDKNLANTVQRDTNITRRAEDLTTFVQNLDEKEPSDTIQSLNSISQTYSELCLGTTSDLPACQTLDQAITNKRQAVDLERSDQIIQQTPQQQIAAQIIVDQRQEDDEQKDNFGNTPRPPTSLDNPEQPREPTFSVRDEATKVAQQLQTNTISLTEAENQLRNICGPESRNECSSLESAISQYRVGGCDYDPRVSKCINISFQTPGGDVGENDIAEAEIDSPENENEGAASNNQAPSFFAQLFSPNIQENNEAINTIDSRLADFRINVDEAEEQYNSLCSGLNFLFSYQSCSNLNQKIEQRQSENYLGITETREMALALRDGNVELEAAQDFYETNCTGTFNARAVFDTQCGTLEQTISQEINAYEASIDQNIIDLVRSFDHLPSDQDEKREALENITNQYDRWCGSDITSSFNSCQTLAGLITKEERAISRQAYLDQLEAGYEALRTEEVREQIVQNEIDAMSVSNIIIDYGQAWRTYNRYCQSDSTPSNCRELERELGDETDIQKALRDLQELPSTTPIYYLGCEDNGWCIEAYPTPHQIRYIKATDIIADPIYYTDKVDLASINSFTNIDSIQDSLRITGVALVISPEKDAQYTDIIDQALADISTITQDRRQLYEEQIEPIIGLDSINGVSIKNEVNNYLDGNPYTDRVVPFTLHSTFDENTPQQITFAQYLLENKDGFSGPASILNPLITNAVNNNFYCGGADASEANCFILETVAETYRATDSLNQRLMTNDISIHVDENVENPSLTLITNIDYAFDLIPDHFLLNNIYSMEIINDDSLTYLGSTDDNGNFLVNTALSSEGHSFDRLHEAFDRGTVDTTLHEIYHNVDNNPVYREMLSTAFEESGITFKADGNIGYIRVGLNNLVDPLVTGKAVDNRLVIDEDQTDIDTLTFFDTGSPPNFAEMSTEVLTAYTLDPEQLQADFPILYDAAKEIIGVEYETVTNEDGLTYVQVKE